MGIRIKRVAVLGAGVMGQGIAAHLANAGIPSYLFDIAPGELTEEEKKKGLTLESRAVRNRIADAGVAAMIKAKPARKTLSRSMIPGKPWRLLLLPLRRGDTAWCCWVAAGPSPR